MQLILGDHVIDCTDRTVVMGILNLSDDSPIAGSIVDRGGAVERAVALRRSGAELIDVGARSTRAGARALTPQEEIERVCPVIEALSHEGIATAVDTWTAAVARAAAEAGVALLNDVTGFTDPEMVRVVADHRLAACVMHMRGVPTRHYEVDQSFDDVATEVREFLLDRAETLEAAGAGQVWLDPGFAFGKSVQDNLRLLDSLPALVATGHPVLISASRKGFLAELLGHGEVQEAPGLPEATIAFNTLAAHLGAHVVRVHDVEAVTAALRVVNAVRAQRRAATIEPAGGGSG